jgi:hypothetical protein
MRSNKDEGIQMMEDIHRVLCAIISLYTATQNDGILPPTMMYDIAKFAEYGPKFNVTLAYRLIAVTVHFKK